MKAVIAGGGIGGLAVALALSRRGWQVEVLEQGAESARPGPGGAGAGLSLWPNAVRALGALGLGDPVRARALSGAPAGIQDAAGRWLSRADTSDLERRYGPMALLHRGDLLGDAAHAMTPDLGQGACQALEDAVVLADSVPDGSAVVTARPDPGASAGTATGPGDSVASGLTGYDRARRSRTQMIARRSRRIGAVAQWSGPAAVSLRNASMRLLPGSSLTRSLAPLLSWSPEA